MENKSNEVRNTIIFGIIMIIFALIYYLVPQKSYAPTYDIPLPDPSKGEPYIYSVQKQEWLYKRESMREAQESSRAKALKDEQRAKQQIEKHLRDNIKDYESQTFWGEKYDPNK